MDTELPGSEAEVNVTLQASEESQVPLLGQLAEAWGVSGAVWGLWVILHLLWGGGSGGLGRT